MSHQVVIGQWLAWRLTTSEVPGLNPGKGENLSITDQKGNSINLNLNTIIVWVCELTGLVLELTRLTNNIARQHCFR